MSCCKTYDPCLDNKINQIGSYASAARQSAQNSASSAAAAGVEATQAASSAAAAAASAEAAAISAGLSGVYLGAFAIPPATDNVGGPLQDGMLYYNTGSNTLFVWNGSSWSAIQDDEIYLGGFAVAPTLNNQGLPLQLGNLYWNSATNDLWAYDGVAWGLVTFNEFTPFLATGTTFARNLVTREADIINVKDFGAVGDGVTDDTAAIQAAINYGKSIFIPDGIYNLTAGLVVNSQINIFGNGKSSILHNINNNLQNPILLIKSPASNQSNICDFSIISVDLINQGAHGIEIEGGAGFMIRNIRVRKTYKGIYVSKPQFGAHIESCIVEGAVNDGIHINNGNMIVNNSYTLFSGRYGFNSDASGAGLIITNCTNYRSLDNGFNISNAGSQTKIDFFMSNCVNSFSTQGHGFYIDCGGKNIIISDCFSEGAGVDDFNVTPTLLRHGIFITDRVRRININNCQATFSGGSGLVLDCSFFNVNGGDYCANGLLGNTETAGVIVGLNNPVSSFTINGVNTRPSTPNDINFQFYGINVFQPGSNRGTITACVLSGVTRQINIDSSTDIQIQNCANFINNNKGVATITAGTNFVSFPHGLSYPPNNILITPRGVNLSGISYWADLSTTPGNIVILLSSNATVNTSFYWEASR
jgi:hypothetical protein